MVLRSSPNSNTSGVCKFLALFLWAYCPVRVEVTATLHFHAPRLIRDIARPVTGNYDDIGHKRYRPQPVFCHRFVLFFADISQRFWVKDLVTVADIVFSRDWQLSLALPDQWQTSSAGCPRWRCPKRLLLKQREQCRCEQQIVIVVDDSYMYLLILIVQ